MEDFVVLARGSEYIFILFAWNMFFENAWVLAYYNINDRILITKLENDFNLTLF
jgi:hypothetical protein